MGQGRGRSWCALWGGICLGVGTFAFALFSSSSVGCSTNVVVLTHSAVTARGCAAFSVVSHVGVGLLVLGAVLLLGSFAFVLRTRRQTDAPAPPTDAPAPPTDAPPPPTDAPAPGPGDASSGVTYGLEPTTPTDGPGTRGPIAPGEDPDERSGPFGGAVRLPPGWYGNPDSPGRPVQWWDGTKLIDRPG